jgi:hypothetical protein
MSSKAEWNCRRQEIRKLTEKFAYGEKPAKPTTVTGTVSSTSITVSVSHNGKSSSFSASVSLPSGTGPFPAVVVLQGIGVDTNTIRSAGAAIINYDPYSVGKEGTGRTNKQGAFYTIYGATSQTGLLQAWGWGVSRIIDVIESNGGSILKPVVGVSGCSRFGKGAFLIGAFDQRIALTMPVESGSAGVPIFRGIPGEGAQSLSSAYGEQPWLGDAFGNFTSSPTRLPIDTHSTLAQFAPRGLFIMDNPHIANLGPRSAHAAALAGSEVYKALGASDALTYHSNIADGNHCATRSEWTSIITANVRKFLVGQSGQTTGQINAHSKATANRADWIDWTTPTLSNDPGNSSSSSSTTSTQTTVTDSTTTPTTTTTTTTQPPVNVRVIAVLMH